jgi:putative spermidine/putrescine transport system permease protein
VPGIVIGISLLVALAAIDVREAPVRLVLAHVLVVMPYSMRTVLASLSQVDDALEEAALTLGATPLTAFFLVTLPLIRPGVIAGAVFSFIVSFDDVAVSLFLIDARTGTLPIAIMSYLEQNFDPSIAAISSLLIFVTLPLALGLERFFGLKRLLGA